jgi:predicted ABC-type ATPase
MVIAGANGAGKSTFTRGRYPRFSQLPLLDPDAIAKTSQVKNEPSSPLQAGRQVLRLAAAFLDERRSFSLETTLSGKSYLQMLVRARELGFDVSLVYIGTESVEINLARVASRVLDGGHDVPEADVRRRYARSFANLPTAIQRVNRVVLFDNSTEQGYVLAGLMDDNTWEWMEPLPAWAALLRELLAHLPS